MIPEILSSGLASIKCSANQSNLPNVLKPKFRTTDDVVLLGTGRLEVSIPDIGGLNIYTVQCGVCKCNTDTVSGDYSSIG